ncbi:MAG: VWA domain-containing protein [Desulfobacterales bacterium]|nr:VWA domain-containing protein [Desulfobacterales bacterium]
MQIKSFKSLLFLITLIVLTFAAMAYSKLDTSRSKITTTNISGDAINLSGSIAQEKIFVGGDGNVSLLLNLKAQNIYSNDKEKKNIDMVIVLDRSGSMQGEKINNAKQAVLKLLSSLSDNDRFALISYSDNVFKHSDFITINNDNLKWLSSIIYQIIPDGSTNLGDGLKEGINLFLNSPKNENNRKLILISDGLANVGITDPIMLGSIASIASNKAFSISSVGVGSDFNEQLMTSIADQGCGKYYFLDNASLFAEVFQKELNNTKATIATNLEIRVPQSNGIKLLDASGYPVKLMDGYYAFYPGDIMSGQTKKLFLTFNLPVNSEKRFEISNISIKYLHGDKNYVTTLSNSFHIACVKNSDEAIGSINKNLWEEKVLNEDYNKLKEEVAQDIQKGAKKEAISRIQKYHDTQQALNSQLGSIKVEQNLKKDINELREVVNQTFEAPHSEIEHKQKINAKFLQYDGYKQRRNN